MTTTVPKKIVRAAKKLVVKKQAGKLDVDTLLASARTAYLAAVAVLARKYASEIRRGIESDKNLPAELPLTTDDPRKKPFLWEFSFSLHSLPICREPESQRFVIAVSPQLNRPFAKRGGVEMVIDKFIAAGCLARDIVQSAIEQGLISQADGKLMLTVSDQ